MSWSTEILANYSCLFFHLWWGNNVMEHDEWNDTKMKCINLAQKCDENTGRDGGGEEKTLRE